MASPLPRRSASGRSADLRGFASMLAEALPRVAGADEDQLQKLGEHLELVATGREPASVQALVVELDSIIDGVEPVAHGPRAYSLPAFHNPYKGLRAFVESDADDFFGRDRLIDHIIERLQSSDGVVTVLGPSGVGKSSVIRAGVIPALRRSAIPGSHDWFVATMTPGTDPFDELATALLRIADRVPANLTDLLGEPGGIGRLVRSLLPEDGTTELLLVVDQFEELFTLVDDEDVRVAFLENLEAACRDERCRMRVVLSIRADFWDRPLRYGSFARLVEESVVHVAALEPDELELAITGPAHRTGCEFEPGLVARIVTDVHNQPGALPHMQFALTELMERNKSRLLTIADYEGIGGVAGAVATAAENLYQRAAEDSRDTIRQLFGRLVVVNPGSSATRDRVAVSSLENLGDIEPILRDFGEARLLAFDRSEDTREPTVEIAHEALIGAWPTAGSLARRGRRAAHRPPSTWRGRESLVGARPGCGRVVSRRQAGCGRGGSRNTRAPSRRAPEFLTESQAARDREREARRRSVRRLQGLLAGVACLAVLAMIAGVLAFQNAANARDSRAAAETRRLSSDASIIGLENPDTALLLAAEAHRRDPSASTLLGCSEPCRRPARIWDNSGTGRSTSTSRGSTTELLASQTSGSTCSTSESRRTIWIALICPSPLGASLLDWEDAPKPFDVEGDTLAVGLSSGEIFVLNVVSQERTIVRNSSNTNAVALSPDRSQLAVGSVDRTVRVFNLVNGQQSWETLAYTATALEEIEKPPGVIWLLELQPSFLPRFTAQALGSGITDVDWLEAPSGQLSVVAAGGTEVHTLDAVTGERFYRAVPISEFQGDATRRRGEIRRRSRKR